MINWARVEELISEIGKDDFQEIVVLFLEEVEEALNDIQQITEPNALRDKVHFLKGSMLNLGFEGVGRLCQAAEAALPETDPDMALLISKYETSKTEFLSKVSNA